MRQSIAGFQHSEQIEIADAPATTAKENVAESITMSTAVA